MNMLIIAGGVIGAVIGYVAFLRPVLETVPVFREMYRQESTVLGKLWAVCGRSASILWSYFLTALAALWGMIDPLAEALGDPNLRDQLLGGLKGHPAIVGYVVFGVAGVTLVARVRSIRKKGRG